MPPGARKTVGNGGPTQDGNGTAASAVERKIQLRTAPAWRPLPGTTMLNPTVVGVRRGDGGQYGPYPILVVETPAGEVWAIHAFHTLLRNQLTELRPTPGTLIESITYVGRNETNESVKKFAADGKEADRTFYHHYLVTMPDDEDSEGFLWEDVKRPTPVE
jgi:hypothetical protein